MASLTHTENSHSWPRAALQHFYISHRSDSNTEHRKRERERKHEALTGTSTTSNRHLLTCWALLGEKQLHSVHTPLAWAKSEENNTDRKGWRD